MIIFVAVYFVAQFFNPFFADVRAQSVKPKIQKEYKDGRLVNTKIFDEQGRLYKEISHHWAEGVPGTNRTYYPDGKLKEEYVFENGCLQQHKKFDEEGRLTFDSQGQCWAERRDREFYKNGQLKKETIYQSLRLAGVVEYDEKG